MAYKGWTNYSTWNLASLLNNTQAERTNVMEMAKLSAGEKDFAGTLQEMYVRSFTSFFESKGVATFKGITLEHLKKVNWNEISEAVLVEARDLKVSHRGYDLRYGGERDNVWLWVDTEHGPDEHNLWDADVEQLIEDGFFDPRKPTEYIDYLIDDVAVLPDLEMQESRKRSKRRVAELSALGPDEYGGPEMGDPDPDLQAAKDRKNASAPVAEAEDEEEEEADDDEPETEDHLHSAEQIVDLTDVVEKIVADYEELENEGEEGEDDMGMDDLSELGDMEMDYAAPALDDLDI